MDPNWSLSRPPGAGRTTTLTPAPLVGSAVRNLMRCAAKFAELEPSKRFNAGLFATVAASDCAAPGLDGLI